MATTTDERPAVPDELVARAPRRGRMFAPGWPLAWLFVPFPLWWVMGLQEWICLILAIPMALHLFRQREVLVPKGFGFWIVFLGWVTAGVFLLQVDAYGAVADDSSTRYITWGYRVLWYVAVTVVGLYVINTRRRVSTTRVARIMAMMFLTIVAGGLLGTFARRFEFPSLLELVLPNGITNTQFVYKMIHPTAAQLMDVLGYESPRPSAPFFYTNTWGLNFAVFLPFFFYAWLGKDAGWRKLAAPFVLMAAVVPMIVSVDRGLWLALACMALFAAIRAAFIGKPLMLTVVAVGTLVLGVVVALTPLGAVVEARLSNAGSEQGRANLSTLSLTSVVQTAPISGLGSTRNVQGNFNTIAGGASASCPRCSPPSLGTQGQLWLVVYSQGLVGLALFLTFFVIVFLRYLRHKSPESNLGLSVLVAGFVTMPFYNSLGTGLMAVMVAVGVMARSGPNPLARGPHWTVHDDGSLRTLSSYLRPAVAHRGVLAGCVVAGLAGGLVWNASFGAPVKATASVFVPDPPRYQERVQGPMSIDTIGQLLTTEPVVSAASAAGGSAGSGEDALALRAIPNSRIFQISYTANERGAAVDGVNAAVRTFLDQRRASLTAANAAEVKRLGDERAALDTAVRTLETALRTVQGGDRPSKQAPLAATETLRHKKSQLLTEITDRNRQVARTLGDSLSPGMQIRDVKVVTTRDPLMISLVGGGLLGLLAGVIGILLLGRRGPRLREGDSLLRESGLPVLASPPRAERRGRLGRRRRSSARHDDSGYFATVTTVYDGATFLAVDESDPRLVTAARQLNASASATVVAPHTRARVLLVAAARSRMVDVIAARDRCERWGNPVGGVVLL